MKKITEGSVLGVLLVVFIFSQPFPAMSQPYAGFNLAFSEGVFWDFQWDYDHNYWSSFGSDREKDSGTFRVRLGSPILIGGIAAYEVQVTGKSKASSTELGPRWKYLASANNQILGSTDGAALVILFDGQTGKWPGSGLFATYPSNKLLVAQASQISNNYINEPAIAVGQSSSSSQCEYFPGVGTICGGDYSTSDIETEYYEGGIGPVGLYKYFAISDMTNYYPWSATTTIHVGLIASSLRGDKVFHVFEKEPNDSPAAAQTADIGGGIRGFASDADQGTLMTLSQTAEFEPNSSPITPQTLILPTIITGNIKDNDGSTAITFSYQSRLWDRLIEDWSWFTLSAPTQVQVELIHQGPTTAEIQLYLFNNTGTTVMGQVRCFDEEQYPTTATRSINCALDAGSYLLAVDAWNTGGVTINYTLDVLKGRRSIEDFYSFTVTNPGPVTFELNIEDPLANLDVYVFDGGGTSLLGASNATGDNERMMLDLNPGAYIVAVDAYQGSSNYTLTIKDTTFCDVLKDNWAYSHVEALYNSGITGGCSQNPLLFCPDQSVTRGQMAVFIEAFLGHPANTCSGRFTDVPASNPFCGFIERMADEGITSGCGNGRFCPNDPVTRGQMAVFIEAALGNPANPCMGRFTDVPSGSFCGFIERMADDGVTGGCGAGIFCPNEPVTRAQMAVFLIAAPPPVTP